MNILFLQHGDFKEAYERLIAGGAETYRDQRESVFFVKDLTSQHNVTVAYFGGDSEPGQYKLSPNLTALALDKYSLSPDQLAALFDHASPDRMICRTPHVAALREAGRRKIPTLPTFADIFTASLRHVPRNLRLLRALRQAKVPCVANHSLNASRSVKTALFWPSSHIVPWDWSRIPVDPSPKTAAEDPDAPTLFFAGALTEAKGVGDCLRALELVRASGRKAKMTFAGWGDMEQWRTRAQKLSLSDAADFVGMLSHREVREQMRAHDFVVVPSRHNYPEGLPNTIYEGLASRSPLILSDHPAFRGRVPVGEACLEFAAEDAKGLAACIDRLCRDPDLYARLSTSAETASDGLYIGLEWPELASLFLADPENRSGWVQRNSLSVRVDKNSP